MWLDSDLVTCPICSQLGTTSPDIWGDVQFFHKVPSPRLEGYYTFTQEHLVIA